MGKEIEVGQVWALASTGTVPPLMVFIGRIDVLHDEAVASVLIKTLRDLDQADWPDVGHMPIAVQTSDIQLGRLVREGIDLGADFERGFGIWWEKYQDGKARFFTDCIGDAYSSVVTIRNDGIKTSKRTQ